METFHLSLFIVLVRLIYLFLQYEWAIKIDFNQQYNKLSGTCICFWVVNFHKFCKITTIWKLQLKYL